MRVFNKAIKVERSKYEEEIQKYVNNIKNISGVEAIYTMGSIGAPGLSDIDIIVKVADTFHPRKSKLLSITNYDRNLFLHGPIVIPHHLSDKIQYLFYASNIINIYGNDKIQQFEELDPSRKKHLSFIYLIDFLESRFQQYEIAIHNKSINHRMWMTRIWSITHSYNLLQNANLDLSLKDKEILDDIINLRKSWLNGNPYSDEEFINTFFASYELTKSLFNIALKFLYPEISEHKSDLNIGNKYIKFSRSSFDIKYKTKSINILKRRFYAHQIQYNIRYLMHLQNYLIPKKVDYTSDLHSLMSYRQKLILLHNRWIWRHCPHSKSMLGYSGITKSNTPYYKQILLTMIYKLIKWI